MIEALLPRHPQTGEPVRRQEDLPFFQRQIAAGGPVTVTHPDVRRYFMTIPEAVQLVLQAAALGHGGEVFVLDMGQPVRIVDLARDLIRLSGLEPEHDIEIRFTGLRPGEKLFEELFAADEEYGRTRHEKIFVAQNGRNDDLRDEVLARLLALNRDRALQEERAGAGTRAGASAARMGPSKIVSQLPS